MARLHNKLKDRRLVPKEGQRGLLCSNKESIRCPSLGNDFSEEELQNFEILLKDLAKVFINKALEEYE